MRIHRKFGLPLFFMLVASGCVATMTPNVEPTLLVVDFPPIGTVHTVEIGSSLVEKFHVYEHDAMQLLSAYEYQGRHYTITASPGYYVLKRIDEQGAWYMGQVESCPDDCSLEAGGFLVRSSDGRVKIHDSTANPPFVLKDTPNWVSTKYAAVDTPHFRRELVYTGKSGSTIKLLYREYISDMARPAFTQELTYEIEEDNIIGFQGVRIELLDTSNVSITYRLLNSFPPVSEEFDTDSQPDDDAADPIRTAWPVGTQSGTGRGT